ncbi:unnamed protein product [Discosporangium mesarthrocarpum]
MKTKFWLALAVALPSALSASGENWAVIVAGSRGYMNYRHQADVCHAYHLVRRNGIPSDRVILMSYDDAAASVDNPVRGSLYNKPTPAGVPGYDVYRGCKASYVGQDVTAANFMAVLTGDDVITGGKPVLRSTSEDRVFVYFADHGAVGLVSMPVGEPLYAQDLVDTLVSMNEKKMYKELLLYVEACESGSMFKGLLPSDANIYAVTAANSHESSYGTYCGEHSSVDGTVIGSCLGDLFSVNFLENSDVPQLFQTETLDNQFELLKNKTTLSHVKKFGTSTMGVDPISWFQGSMNFPSLQSQQGRELIHLLRYIRFFRRFGERAPPSDPASSAAVVDSRDITLHTLQFQRSLAEGQSNSAETTSSLDKAITAELAERKQSDTLFWNIAHLVSGDMQEADKFFGGAIADGFTDHTCLKAANNAVIHTCGHYSDYSLKHVRVLALLCEAGFGGDIIDAVHQVCGFMITGNPRESNVMLTQ